MTVLPLTAYPDLNAALNSTIPAEAFRLRWNPFLLTVFPVTFPVAPN